MTDNNCQSIHEADLSTRDSKRIGEIKTELRVISARMKALLQELFDLNKWEYGQVWGKLKTYLFKIKTGKENR